jgi:hypothetical protein
VPFLTSGLQVSRVEMAKVTEKEVLLQNFMGKHPRHPVTRAFPYRIWAAGDSGRYQVAVVVSGLRVSRVEMHKVYSFADSNCLKKQTRVFFFSINKPPARF